MTYFPLPLLRLDSSGTGVQDSALDAARRERAESLRLTQLALGLEIHGFDLPMLAHWVHTGTVLPDAATPAGPDAARWEPGEGSG